MPRDQAIAAIKKATVKTYTTTGAILDIDLHRVAGVGIAAHIDRGRFEIARRLGETIFIASRRSATPGRVQHFRQPGAEQRAKTG